MRPCAVGNTECSFAGLILEVLTSIGSESEAVKADEL